jgi:class 3 adenylate cyclase
MLHLFRNSLAFKLVLLTAVAVAVGFAAAVMASTRIQAVSVDRLHAESASALAHTLAAGVRNSMLTGNGIAVRKLVDDMQAGLASAKVRVFAPDGEEVFAAKPPPPPPESQPAHVRTVLSSLAPARAGDSGDAQAIPIVNEDRCHSCHDPGKLRGVMTLGTHGAKVVIDGSEASLDALARIFTAGFVQLMTAKREAKLDAYFAEVTERTPGVRGIAVYDNGEQRNFGTLRMAVPDEAVSRGVTPREHPFTVAAAGLQYRVVPLPSEARCKGCHKDAGEQMRGALVVAFDPAALRGEQTLLMASETSLQHVMLSGLGRIVQGFLDEVAATGAVTTLTVHDAEGRLYHDAFGTHVPPGPVGEALGTGKEVVKAASLDHPEMLLVEPLQNEKACQTCHGPDRPLRGAIEVRLDTSAASAEILSLRHWSELSAVVTIALVVLLLWAVLHFTVIGPVGRIGLVADLVGDGRFDARVSVSSNDEIGRLGARINDMVAGLREKLALSRFVSQATLETVKQGGGQIVSREAGTRRRMTVLFSDIRGFTAFSETHEPEQVVQMLNHYLQVQADIVVKHGGDIDKFVGDELMARFDGPDMEARAIRCGVEMAAAVEALSRREGAHDIGIGVGVNAGDVIRGAIGSEQRTDFTIIGDAVNLGARLCSAAKSAQVLVTGVVRAVVGDVDGVDFLPLDPIKVKGKQDPIPLYSAVAKRSVTT